MAMNKWSWAALVAALIAPISANALGVTIDSVQSTAPGALQGGDTITFNLRLTNDIGASISGLDVGAFGYDEGEIGSFRDDHLRFESAASGAGAFGVAFASGLNLGGLPAAVPQQEFGNAVIDQERYVRLFGGVALTPATGDGTSDSGINGLQTTPGGDVHLQVTFRAQELDATQANPATVDLVFGIGQQGFDVISPTDSLATDWNNSVGNATFTVTIVPEPGTALLMGLGLAGLAGTRRR
ncbi:MAG: PEP-CTERM sorting domain-containing protein [Myxococcota bacterium]